jgi:hypothetical protein
VTVAGLEDVAKASEVGVSAEEENDIIAIEIGLKTEAGGGDVKRYSIDHIQEGEDAGKG